jgi:hypothetical protein
LAGRGHPVLGVDYAFPALRQGPPGLDLSYVNLNDRRRVLELAARLPAGRPAYVVADHVLESLTPDGVENVLLLARHGLRGGHLVGEVYVDDRLAPPTLDPRRQFVSLKQLDLAAYRHGLTAVAGPRRLVRTEIGLRLAQPFLLRPVPAARG